MIARPAPVLRSAAIGLAAGLIASFAMERFQAAATALSGSDDDGEPATERAADAAARIATGADVSDANKPLAGQLVHYAVGAGLGLGYAVIARRRPGVTAGFGGAFGLATAALLDEVAVPAAGFGPPPWKTPAATHAYSLASHLLFGAAVEGARRALDAAWPARA